MTRHAITVALTLSMLTACSDDAPDPASPGGTPTAVDVRFCTGIEPTWVAFQDGDGAWTPAQPAVAGTLTSFHHLFTTNRGAIATVKRFAGGRTTLSILYGAPTELAILGDTDSQLCGPVLSNTLFGTIAGLDERDIAFVSAGRSSRAVAFPDEANTFALHDLTGGPQDVLASRVTLVDGEQTVTDMILRRRLELPNGATIPVLDFRSQEVFQPEARNVSLAGLGPEGALHQTGLRTAYSEHVVSLLTSSLTSTPRPYQAIPAARLEPGDVQFLEATSAPTNGYARRSAAVYFRSPSNLTLALGSPLMVPEFSVVSSSPTLRLRARFEPQADYDRLTTIAYQQGANIFVSVAMTPTYAALAGTGYDLIVPELTGVQGFESPWALRSGVATLWSASRVGGSLGLGPDAVPVDGSTRRGAADAGSIKP